MQTKRSQSKRHRKQLNCKERINTSFLYYSFAKIRAKIRVKNLHFFSSSSNFLVHTKFIYLFSFSKVLLKSATSFLFGSKVLTDLIDFFNNISAWFAGPTSGWGGLDVDPLFLSSAPTFHFQTFFFFMSAKTFVFSFFSLLLSPTKPLWILIRQKKQFFLRRDV